MTGHTLRGIFSIRRIANSLILTVGVLPLILIGGDKAQDPCLERLHQNYRKSIPFRVDFTITQILKLNGDSIESLASFYLGKNEKFKTDFPEQEILFDGKWLWSLDKQTDEVVVEEFEPSSSLKFLFDILHGNWENFFIDKILESKDGFKEVQLRTRDENDFFRAIVLLIDTRSNLICRANYMDFQGNRTEIRFEKFDKLTNKSEALFNTDRFKGKELIDLRF